MDGLLEHHKIQQVADDFFLQKRVGVLGRICSCVAFSLKPRKHSRAYETSFAQTFQAILIKLFDNLYPQFIRPLFHLFNGERGQIDTFVLLFFLDFTSCE